MTSDVEDTLWVLASAQSDTSKYLCKSLLSKLSTAFLAPIEATKTSKTEQEFDFLDLCRKRSILVEVLNREKNVKVTQPIPKEPLDSFSLGLLKILGEIDLEESHLNSALDLFWGLNSSSDLSLKQECVNFCCSLLGNSFLSNQLKDRALKIVFALGKSISTFEVLRILPYVIRTSADHYPSFMEYFASLARISYPDLMLLPQNHCLLCLPFDVDNRNRFLENLGSEKVEIKLIGDLSLCFSPTNFVAVGFSPRLNPVVDFSIEFWVSGEGVVLSSLTDEQHDPRGYRFECNWHKEIWFHFGSHRLYGKSTPSGPENPSVSERKVNKAMAVGTHVVAVVTVDTISLFLNGRVVDMVSTLETVQRTNQDAPFLCGGPKFEGTLKQVAFYATALDIRTIKEHFCQEENSLPLRIMTYLATFPASESSLTITSMACNSLLETYGLLENDDKGDSLLGFILLFLSRLKSIPIELNGLLLSILSKANPSNSVLREKAAHLLAQKCSFQIETLCHFVSTAAMSSVSQIVIQAIFSACQQYPLPSCEALENALDFLLPTYPPQSSYTLPLIHSLLCLYLASPNHPPLSNRTARKCKTLLESDLSLDFQFLVSELLCEFAFAPLNEFVVEYGNCEAFELTTVYKTLFARAVALAPIPPIHFVRVHRKSHEVETMAALELVFAVLLNRLSFLGNYAGLALRCLRAAYGWIFQFLLQQEDIISSAKSIQAACRILFHHNCIEENELFFENDDGFKEEEENAKNALVQTIISLSKRGTVFIDQVLQAGLQTATEIENRALGMHLLTEVIPKIQFCLQNHIRNHLVLFSFHPFLRFQTHALDDALKSCVNACLMMNDVRDDCNQLKAEICVKFAQYVSSEGFVWSVKAKDCCPLQPNRNVFNTSDDPFPLFLSNVTSVWNANSLTTHSDVSQPVRALHSLYSGHFEFRFFGSDNILLQVGLGHPDDNAFVCGCFLSLYQGSLTVKLNLEPGGGGVFQVFLDSSKVKYECHVPHKRPLSLQVQLLSCNTPLQIEAISDEGQIIPGPLALKFTSPTQFFASGQNSMGELGLDDSLPLQKRFSESHMVQKLVPCCIAAGNEFSAVVSSQGKVYVWGMNSKGQCSTKEEVFVSKPTLVHSLSSLVVTRVCCQNGSENVFAITQMGQAYGWGANKFGSLGFGTLADAVYVPTLLSLPNCAVVDVANGYSHSLFLTSTGTVFSCGLNSHGQLGLGADGDIRPFPQQIQSISSFQTRVAVGLLHSAILDCSGAVWMFGKNEFGQLGLGKSTIFRSTPTKLTIEPIDVLSCGYQFTLLATARGILWGFGKNDFGQLGLGNTKEAFGPQLVRLPKMNSPILSLSCGTGHWICSFKNGRAFTCGRNKFGGIGDGTTGNRVTPLELQNLPLNAIQVAAGFHHTLVLLGEENFVSNVQREDVFSQFVLSSCSASNDAISQACSNWLSEMISTKKWSILVLKCASHIKLQLEYLDVCQHVMLDFSLNQDIRLLALEWIKNICLENQCSPHSTLVSNMLDLVSVSSDDVLVSETVYVLRLLLQEGCVDFTNVWFRKSTQGVLSVLGAHFEVLRQHGRAKLMMSEKLGLVGTVECLSCSDSFLARVRLDGESEPILVRHGQILIPQGKLEVPYFDNWDIVCEVLLLAKKRNGRLSVLACRALSALFKSTPPLLDRFVNDDANISFVSSLLKQTSLSREDLFSLELRFFEMGAKDVPIFENENESFPVSIIVPFALDSCCMQVESIDFDLYSISHETCKGENRIFTFSRGEVVIFPTEIENGFSILIDIAFLSFADCLFLHLWEMSSRGLLGQREIELNCFYRIAFIVGLEQQSLYVNGELLEAKKVSRDLDSSFPLGGEFSFQLSSVQIRRYEMSPESIRIFGRPNAQGFPIPSFQDLAYNLKDITELPLAWCIRTMRKFRTNYAQACALLQGAKSSLIQQGKVNVSRLVFNLGFNIHQSVIAVQSTTSLVESIAFLLENDDLNETFHNKEWTRDFYCAFLPLNFKQSFSDEAFMDSDENLSLYIAPHIVSPVTTPKAEFSLAGDDEMTKDLYAYYAQSIVEVLLDSKYASQVLATKDFFVRDYLCSFQFSEEDNEDEDAVIVLRTKLLEMGKTESGRWQDSMTKSLFQVLLSEIATVYQSETSFDPRLKLSASKGFFLVACRVSDKLSVYRPQCEVGYFSLGDTVDNSTPVLTVQFDENDHNGVVKPPIRFELLYQADDCAFFVWRPVPPWGFASLGVVVSKSSSPPSCDVVRCIHLSCLAPAFLSSGKELIGTENLIWQVKNEARSFLFKSPLIHNDDEGDETSSKGTFSDIDQILEKADWNHDAANVEKCQQFVLPLALSSAPSKGGKTTTAFWLLFLLLDILKENSIWKAKVLCASLVQGLFSLRKHPQWGVKSYLGLTQILSMESSLIDKFKHKLEEVQEDLDRLNSDPLLSLNSPRICAILELLQVVNLGKDGLLELSQTLDSLLLNANFSDEFLMAEDGFLKLARGNDTLDISSLLQNPLMGSIQVENAESLICRFEITSATRLQHGLWLKGREEEFTLAGGFGNVVVPFSGNSLEYRFPVVQKLNWSFSVEHRGSNIKLSSENLCAQMRKDKVWETCCGTKPYMHGFHQWQFTIEKCTLAANIFFGVTKSPFSDSYVGSNESSWGFIGCGALWTNGKRLKSFGDRLRSGDIVRLSLDYFKRTLRFAINGLDQGVAFEQLPIAQGIALFPACSLYNKYDSITVHNY